MVLPTITRESISLEPGDELILRFRSWEDYERLLTYRADKAGLRIRYSSQTRELRILSPLPKHAKNVDVLCDMVKILLRNIGKDWEAFTPVTLKKSDRQGIEPDGCFYIDNREQILGKERIDLDIDPPPDLIIEVDLTSITKPEDYQAIAPAELWIYRRDRLYIYRFDRSSYREVKQSRWFPDVELKTLVPEYIDLAWNKGTSIALREFEEKVRSRSHLS